MATMTRDDVHKPSSMNPADYVWVGALGDYAGDAYYAEMDYERLIEAGAYEGDERDFRVIADDLPFDALTGRRACCHCGNTRIKAWSFFLHVPSLKIVAVGSRCAELLSLTSRDDLARREALIRIERDAQLAEWREADECNERAWDELMAREDEAGGSGGAGNDFVDSLLRYARKNGRLTDAQRDAVLKGIETRAQRAAERAEKAAEMNDPEPAPVVEGRIVVEGRLLSTKIVENDFGGTVKMLVLDDRGFKVWTTCPSAIIDGAFEQGIREGRGGVEQGVKQFLDAGMKCRVRFTATVEKSRKDEAFGFAKRPTKAQVI